MNTKSVPFLALFLMLPRLLLADDPYTVAPLSVVTDRVHPVSAIRNAAGDLFVDFGEDSFAGLELEIPSATAGVKLTVCLGEKLSEVDKLNPKPGGCVRFLQTELELDPSKQTYVVPLSKGDTRRLAKEVGAVMPFRYVEIPAAPAGLDANHIFQLAVHYPFDDNAGYFACSDPKLNEVWKICRHTIKATSFGGVFIDGDRERKPYEADAYIDQLGWYCSTPDVTLPRISWQYLIKNPTWPTEWILFSVLMAWNDYLYTGDKVGISKYYNELQAKTLLALERPDGLISSAGMPESVGNSIHIDKIQDLVDWPAGERDGNQMLPVNTVVNAFHIMALRRMGQLAAALGHPDDAQKFQTAADHALFTFNQKLFDPVTGLYVDGEGSQHSSAHANFFPLAFGLIPAERQEKIVTFLAGKGMPCSVYGAQFLLETLFDHGHADDALNLMTAPTDRSWTHMIQDGSTMTWEAWDSKYKKNQDWNHAWGAAPANLLPRKLMGIEPLEPGFTKILIQPRPSSLKWSEVRMPTVQGSVYARYESPTLAVEIPPGATGKIGLPVSLPDGPATVTVDGQPVSGHVVDKTVFIDGISAGKHTIAAK